MPDTSGFPTEAECLRKINFTAPDPATAQTLREVQPLLAATLARFQAPIGPKNTGGTGRSFVAVTETRTFDGNGRSELPVHELRPPVTNQDGSLTNPITVSIYDYTLSDVLVRTPAAPGLPHNVLYRYQYNGDVLNMVGDNALLAVPDLTTAIPYPQRVFSPGLQNISITATWGGVVTPDIYEALRSEVCYQWLVGCQVGLNGVGEELEMDGFSISTSVGAINFKLTSPLTVYHQLFVDAINTYRLRPQKRFVRMGPRMI